MSDPLTLHRITAGRLLEWTAAVYFLYALYLLGETFDFLSMLHSKPRDFSPTYDLVNVVYYIVDMIVCLALGFAFLIMRTNGRRGWSLVALCLSLAALRALLVHYLYVSDGSDPDVRWVPYIYKVGNDFSGAVRFVMLPAQVLLSIAAAWCVRPPRGWRPDEPFFRD